MSVIEVVRTWRAGDAGLGAVREISEPARPDFENTRDWEMKQ